MKKTVLFMIFIFVCSYATSQDYEFGEVSKEELNEKYYVKDSSANAAILYKRQYTYIESANGRHTLITEIQERIKFYSKDGFEHATEQVNLYVNGSTHESVSKIKAYTYNLQNGKIEKTKLDKDQIFETEVSYNYEQVNFTMPNVQEGSIVEFKYQIRSPYIWNIDEFRFQYDIPVKKLEAQLRTPEGFKFRPTPKGFIYFNTDYSVQMDHRIGMNVNIKTYDLVDIPALKEESFVDNIHNYRAGVVFELISVELPQYFKSYAHSWSDVAATIGSTDDYKNQLNKTNAFDDDIDALLRETAPDQLDKMKAIFDYVKSNIKWNGIDGKNFYNGIKKTLKEKTGNAADINLLTVAMLRYAGIEANPLVLSTKDNLVPFFPTVDRLNYVIALAEIEGQQYFMDATDEFSDINLLPVKVYNWQGLYINNNKEIWKQVSLKEPNKAQTMYMLDLTLEESGEIDGSVKSRFTNHAAYHYRNRFKDADEDSYIKNLESRYDDIEISDFNNKNTDSYSGYVSESFNFYSDNLTEVVSDKIYFSPLLFFGIESNPFKQKERLYPVDFGTSNQENYTFTITIPKNYKVVSLPENAVVKLPENLGEFSFMGRAANDKITFKIDFEISKPIIQAKNYVLLKEFFQYMINKESEQVVLSKA